MNAPPPRRNDSAGGTLRERIHREGPIPFDAFVEGALYGPDGFFEQGRGAGRAGTRLRDQPEIGPLFGALVARALDGWWRELGRLDPFFVVEAGAGGAAWRPTCSPPRPECLARAALRAGRAVRRAPRRRSASCSRSSRSRTRSGRPLVADDDTEAVPVTGAGPIVTSLGELPGSALRGVVLANELLDNLPFRVVERDARRLERGARRRSTTIGSWRCSCPLATSSRPRPTSSRARRRRRAAPGSRPDRGARVAARVRAGARPRCRSWSSTTSRRHAELVAAGAAGLAAHVPRPRARRAAARRTRLAGHHRRPPRRVPRARRPPGRVRARRRHRARPSGCATLGLDELVADGPRRVGRAGPHR